MIQQQSRINEFWWLYYAWQQDCTIWWFLFDLKALLLVVIARKKVAIEFHLSFFCSRSTNSYSLLSFSFTSSSLTFYLIVSWIWLFIPLEFCIFFCNAVKIGFILTKFVYFFCSLIFNETDMRYLPDEICCLPLHLRNTWNFWWILKAFYANRKLLPRQPKRRHTNRINLKR